MTKSEATKQGSDLAKMLSGVLNMEWYPRVWDNFGWHCAADSSDGHWCVHVHHTNTPANKFTAFLGEKDSGAGYWAESADTPERAVAKTLQVAYQNVMHYVEILGGNYEPPVKILDLMHKYS